jgi:putative RecB family exonuclease
MMRISYSQFAAYRRCPQLYRLQYIEKIAVPVGPELHFGAAVHDALNRMYEPGRLERPSLEEVIEAFIRSWRGREGQVAEEKRQTYFEQGVELLRRHYEAHPAPEDDRRTAATELRFSLDLPAGHALHGRIDRVDVLDGNRLEVIDYKTSRRMPPQETVEKNAQLAIYRMAADALYPGFQVTTTLFYLFHDHQMRTVQSQGFLDETKDDILDAIVRIELEEFEPDPGTHCEWCAYQGRCQLYLAPVEPEDLDINIEEALGAYWEASSAEREAKARKERARALIDAYLDECGAQRVERGGYLAERRGYKRITSWDMARLREVLEPLGRWEDVTQVSTTSVRDLLKSAGLSRELKRAIEEAAEYSDTRTLRVRPLIEDEDTEETVDE